MFITFLFAFTKCHNPIVLVPGLLGSVLKGNITERYKWYCPLLNNEVAWFKGIYAVYPLYNCLFNSIRLEWNETSKKAEQISGVDLDIVDFGGLDGITYIDTLFYDTHVVPYYKLLVDDLLEIGYQERKDLFGCPFDWRFGLLQGEKYWAKVKDLIEKAYELNDNKKVVLIGHSMGCFFINYFCMNLSTPEWRKKYIENVILAAPSFGGSGAAYYSMYSHELPLLPFLGTFPESAGSVGGLQIHVPNYEIFGNTTLFINEKGRKFTAKELVDVLIMDGKLTEDQQKMMNLHTKFFEQAPPAFDVPTAIIYNSGLPNKLGIDKSQGVDDIIYGRGDLAVNAEGPEYVCKNWKADCFDLIKVTPLSNHITMMYESTTLNWIIEHATNSSWY